MFNELQLLNCEFQAVLENLERQVFCVSVCSGRCFSCCVCSCCEFGVWDALTMLCIHTVSLTLEWLFVLDTVFHMCACSLHSAEQK